MNIIISGATDQREGNYGNSPPKAHDFERSSTQYLEMSDTDFGAFDREKFAISLFAKRESVSGSQMHTIMSQQAFVGGGISFLFRFNNDKLEFITSANGLAIDGRLLTTATYTSTTSYYHILAHFDLNNEVETDRMKLFVDGARVSSFDVDTTQNSPPTPASAVNNSTATMRIGNNGVTASPLAFDGDIFNIAFFSGKLPPPEQLRDVTTGKPKSVLGMKGLWSHLNTRADSIVNDSALAANWTNVNAVTLSTDIP